MAHTYFSTLDITAGTEVKDYSPYFYRLPLPGAEAKLWNLLSKRQDAQGTLTTWFEDADIPISVTSVDSTDGDLTASAGDTNLVFASGETAAGFLRVGTQLRDITGDKEEVIELSVDNGSESWTIVRGIGGSSPEVHDRDSVWEKIGTPQYEGSAFGTPVGANRVPRTNTMSILDEQIRLTRSQLRQIMHAVSDNWIWTLERAMRHFERQMERHVLWSFGVDRATNAPGNCKGIVDLIEQYGSSDLINASFGTWKYSAIDDVLLGYYNRGYDESADLVILCPPACVQATAYFHESALRGDYGSETTKGLRATHIMSTMNQMVPLIPVAGLGNRFIVGPLEKVAVRFVDTMLAYDIPLGTNGNDYAARRFISEFTVELHDAATAWYLAKAVNYVVPED